ncbi:hypothetical protein GF420_15710 [candidate division GN15 bacterium]|nr:hypothetical protein [candidate division GN15 bacterium]
MNNNRINNLEDRVKWLEDELDRTAHIMNQMMNKLSYHLGVLDFPPQKPKPNRTSPLTVQIEQDVDAFNPTEEGLLKFESFNPRHIEHREITRGRLGFKERVHRTYGNLLDKGKAFLVGDRGESDFFIQDCLKATTAGVVYYEGEGKPYRKSVEGWLERYSMWCQGEVFLVKVEDNEWIGGLYGAEQVCAYLNREYPDRVFEFTGQMAHIMEQ